MSPSNYSKLQTLARRGPLQAVTLNITTPACE